MSSPSIFKKIFLGLIIALSFLTLSPKNSLAQFSAADLIGGPAQIVSTVWDKISATLKKAWDKAGSVALNTAIRTALNQVAMESATYIGSGGTGQKPLFITEDWGAYAKKVGDAAAGDFIDGLNKWSNINLCEPGLDVKARIGLGLVQYAEPSLSKPDCSASRMINAWKTEADKWASMKSPDYLRKIGTMFQPTGNDLSVSLGLMSGVAEESTLKKSETMAKVQATKGWLTNTNAAGKSTTPPGEAEAKLAQARDLQNKNLAQFTGTALVDAANIFLNQLAITAFNKAMSTLGSKDPNAGSMADRFKTMADDWGSVFKYGAQAPVGGEDNLNSRLTKIIKPQFNVRGDYNVLAELTICDDPSKPGPTNCAIDDQFREAIENKKTVITAIEEGFLNKNWQMKRSVDYNSGYSLRSMMILRGFRIIPVGWENAIIESEKHNAVPTLIDIVSCFDPNDEYSEFSAGFVPGSWCQGLIDPNWVLKAPLNYCKSQGFGGQVADKVFTPGYLGADNKQVPGSVTLIRSDNYCADNQSCIKEKADGTCEAYGYCTEEKRTWNFGADSCDPVFNTCQTFIKSDGQKIAYLEDTLNYDNCDSSSAGCHAYSTTGKYTSSSDKIAWSNTDLIYLNRQTGSCDNTSEGCSRLIRLASGNGHNLLINSDFEEAISVGDWDKFYDGSANGASIINDGYSSANALKVINSVKKSVEVGPSSYDISGQAYTFSFYAKDCAANSQLVIDTQSLDLKTGSDWNYYALTKVFPDNVGSNKITVAMNGACTIDKVKLENSKAGTLYSPYGMGGETFEKILPNYLAGDCYVNPYAVNKNYSLKNGAPVKCQNFARQCNADEVGCDLYTSANLMVPAKVSAIDACPSTCVGYNTFVSRPTTFVKAEDSNFIPSTASACQSQAVGCTEFTNLDELAKGGEAKEYYTYLRQCIKPDTAKCSVFYSWGNTDQGYQLKAYSLQAASDEPVTITNDSSVCNATIYNLPPTDAQYNPNCRQFYNKAGKITYHLYTNTITCSTDCHPYRLSELQSSDLSLSDCTGATRHWDTNTSQCFVCSGGGVWDTAQGACVYMAVPSEGQTCAASDSGCREYNGNQGNNVKNLLVDDFEKGLNWSDFCSARPSIANEAINKDGHSLFYDYHGGACANQVIKANDQGGEDKLTFFNKLKIFISALTGGSIREAIAQTSAPDEAITIPVTGIRQGASYTLRFLAKSPNNTEVKAYFSLNGQLVPFNLSNQNTVISIKGTNEWQTYQLDLLTLSGTPTANDKLVISANNDFSLDNVILSEITDRYYLIKDSWQTPGECYYDTFDIYQGDNYNLGCSIYTDRRNNQVALRNFSRLCSDSAIGCELMIGTANSQDPADDEFMYVVYDDGKLCDAGNKGCSRLGQSSAQNKLIAQQNIYKDVYLKNDPDKADTNACTIDELGCDEFSYENGQSVYFRDPGDEVCEWRAAKTATGQNVMKKWFKKNVKRCDADKNGVINVNVNTNIPTESVLCTDDNDCGGATCILDTNDYLCPVSALKTIGYGGLGKSIYQPDGVAGTCDFAAAGCTEYIDPVSNFSPNLVIDPSTALSGGLWQTKSFNDMKKLSNGLGMYETSTPSFPSFIASTDRNKLYVFSVENNNSGLGVYLYCANGLRTLLSNNTFSTSSPKYLAIPAGMNSSVLFNTLTNQSCQIFGDYKRATISLKAAVIDYKIASDLDKKTCNGQPNLDNGCVMFNERTFAGAAGYAALSSKAFDGSYTDKTFKSCDASAGGACDSNTLIKVQPDRICNKWLACMSQSVDPATNERTCYSLGECDKINEFGRCDNFINTPTSTHAFSLGADKNISGYSILGNYYLANMYEDGIGNTKDLNWDFEKSGFITETPGLKLIQDPDALNSLSQAVSYPAQGQGLLAVKDRTAGIELLEDGTQRFSEGANYYFNFLVNIDGASNGATFEVTIGSGSAKASISLVVDSGTGWQRKILKVTPAKNATGLKISFYSGVPSHLADPKPSSGWVFFDDVSLEPVLKTSDDTYIAKSCRLYPTQDSLGCTAKNSNVIANGLYGYCLSLDPKDPNSCLMWYPVDNIRSTVVNSSASSGFNGLDGKGPDDIYYCAEADGNFKFTEKRNPFVTYSMDCVNKGGCNSTSGNSANSWCSCPSGYQVQWYQECKDSSGVNTDCHGCNGRGDWGNYRACFCYPDLADGLIQNDGPMKIGITNPFNTSATGWAYAGDPGHCDAGWSGFSQFEQTYDKGIFEFNGRDVVSFAVVPGNGDPNVSSPYYVLNEEEPEILDRNGVYTPYKDYQPKCQVLAKASSPWVNRLTDAAYDNSFPEVSPNPYAWFNRLSPNGIYGFSKTGNIISYLGENGNGLPYGCDSGGEKYWNAVSKTWEDTCYSIVASTTDNKITTFGVDYSATINKSPGIFVAGAGFFANDYPNGFGYGVKQYNPPFQNTYPIWNLSNLFLSFTWGNYTYDYSNFQSGGLVYPNFGTTDFIRGVGTIPKCSSINGGKNLRDPARNSWCAVIPEIDNVKLVDSDGVEIKGNNGKYIIKKSDYYTLSFTADVNFEQTPIFSLMVNFGDGNPSVPNSYIDPRSNVNRPFMYVYRYEVADPLNGDVREIKIGVQDNWGFFDCFNGNCPLGFPPK